MRFALFVTTVALVVGGRTAGAGRIRASAELPPLAETIVARDAGPIPLPPPLPRPDAASGIVVARPEPRQAGWERRARKVPRVAVAALFAPWRLAVWSEDRYQVSARASELFWNDAHTIGAYPVATWEGGQSIAGGAAVAFEDVGGTSLRARATAGTLEHYHLAASFDSQRTLGRLEVESAVRARELEDAKFYGVGDVERDEVHYGFAEQSAQLATRWLFHDDASIAIGGSRRRIELVERVDGLTGIDAIRGELSIRIDRRRARGLTSSKAVPATGWGAQAYGGWQHGVGDDLTSFAYGGVDATRAFDLFGGNRVLSVRATVDAVGGGSGDVPSLELPTLGGTELLRGYVSGRFRDRWAAVASAEYTYPISDGFAAFLFVDAGRVAAAATELADAPPRVGAGFGIQVHDRDSLRARVWVAATGEGGAAVSLRLEPVFATRGREVVR